MYFWLMVAERQKHLYLFADYWTMDIWFKKNIGWVSEGLRAKIEALGFNMCVYDFLTKLLSWFNGKFTFHCLVFALEASESFSVQLLKKIFYLFQC